MSIQVLENGFQRISTRGQRANQRFEFWRSLFSRVDVDVPRKEVVKSFKAHLLRYEVSDACGFSYGGNDDTRAHFARPESEFVMLSLPLSGSVDMRLGHDTTYSVKAGDGLLVVDGMQPLISVSKDHSHLCLTVSRAEAAAVLGDDMELLRDGVRLLPLKGLTALTASHLQVMAGCGETLDAASARVAMQAAIDLALGTLAQIGEADGFFQGDLHLDTVHAAARRYILLNFGSQGLTALAVAQALGCSRAHLYRAFEARDQNVGDVIREARLSHAAVLLASSPQLGIEQIAHQCGYGGSAAFARAFRSYAGITASEFRLARRL